LKGEPDNGISQLLVGIKGNLENNFWIFCSWHWLWRQHIR